MLIYNSQYYEQLTWRYPGLPIELPLVTAHHRTDEKSDSRWGCLSTLSCLLSIPMQQTTGCFPDVGLNLYIQFYFQQFLAVQVNICLGFGFLSLETLQCYINASLKRNAFKILFRAIF
jgi:hypothetical protein